MPDTFNANDPLGSDIACVDDIDESMSLVSGNRALAESTARRISTPRTGLFYDPEYGVDLRGKLSAIVRPAILTRIVESEALKDERMLDVSASVTLSETFNEQSETLSVDITIVDETGAVREYTITIDELTVELLAREAGTL